MLIDLPKQAETTWTLSLRATAPLTSLAITPDDNVYCGCWDKQIYGVPLSAGLSRATTRSRLAGHTDFVKCVLATTIGGKPVLLSGGADAVIIVWDLSNGGPLHKLKGHTKALQDLAIDPLSLPEHSSTPSDSFTLFSASSDREIRRWHIGLDAAHELPESLEEPILGHETSVYKLCFDNEGDLWTASADKTAKHLVRSRDWEADTTLQHPDFVRDVVVSEMAGVVVTACRDEEVRVWDASSGDLVCTYSGHFEEVTGLALVSDKLVVSVSIDGTVRRWSLERDGMKKYLESVEAEERGKEDGCGVKSDGGNVMTAEEEAELAELMEDDE
jgi:WD40 repeat protein